MNGMYPIFIPTSTPEPEKTKCPKCGHEWVEEESGDLPLFLVALVFFVLIGTIAFIGFIALDSLDFLPRFYNGGKVFGWFLLVALAVTLICGLIDLFKYVWKGDAR